jgi:hypothetical protein
MLKQPFVHRLAGPAAIFGPAGDDHAELRRDHVEPFREVLANPVQRAAAAGLFWDNTLELCNRQPVLRSAAKHVDRPDSESFPLI